MSLFLVFHLRSKFKLLFEICAVYFPVMVRYPNSCICSIFPFKHFRKFSWYYSMESSQISHIIINVMKVQEMDVFSFWLNSTVYYATRNKYSNIVFNSLGSFLIHSLFISYTTIEIWTFSGEQNFKYIASQRTTFQCSSRDSVNFVFCVYILCIDTSSASGFSERGREREMGENSIFHLRFDAVAWYPSYFIHCFFTLKMLANGELCLH